MNQTRSWRSPALVAGFLALFGALAAHGQSSSEWARLNLRWTGAEVQALGLTVTGIPTSWPEAGKALSGPRLGIETERGTIARVPVRLSNRVFHCEPDPVSGELSGAVFPLDEIEFSVRIPFDESVRSITYIDPGVGTQKKFDLSVLPQSAWKVTWPTTKLVDNGPDDGRLVFAVLGDGYRASEIGQFQADAASVMAGFLSEPPWDVYRALVNVYTVAVESNESGADHPADGLYVDTALDAAYGLPPLQRLLTVNFSKAFQAALSVPTFDLVLVIVNDTEYGGSGGPAAVMSLDNAAVDLGLHEMGHTFAGLADEYESACPGCPTSPVEPNVTDVINPGAIKWSPWVNPGTPLPTPEIAAYSSVVGAFEGAKYIATGNYRPRLNCIMRTLSSRFCEVCAETHIIEVYATPGVGTIDGYSPDNSDTLAYAPGSLVSFSISPSLASAGTYGYYWFVDGIAQADATSETFLLDTSLVSGPATVSVVVIDETPLVRNDPNGHLEDTVSWSLVEGEPVGPVEYAISFPPFYEEGDRLEMMLPASWGLLSNVQWHKGMMALVDDGRIAGASTTTLIIDPLQLSDTGNYSVTFDVSAKAAGTVQSIPIQVFPADALPAMGATGLGLLTGALLLLAWLRIRRRR